MLYRLSQKTVGDRDIINKQISTSRIFIEVKDTNAQISHSQSIRKPVGYTALTYPIDPKFCPAFLLMGDGSQVNPDPLLLFYGDIAQWVIPSGSWNGGLVSSIIYGGSINMKSNVRFKSHGYLCDEVSSGILEFKDLKIATLRSKPEFRT